MKYPTITPTEVIFDVGFGDRGSRPQTLWHVFKGQTKVHIHKRNITQLWDIFSSCVRSTNISQSDAFVHVCVLFLAVNSGIEFPIELCVPLRSAHGF